MQAATVIYMAHPQHRQAVAIYNRACELQLRQDWQAAIAAYDQAIALDPNFAAAYSNRGAAFAAMNRCDEALASLDRAIGLKPDYAEAHFCRAITLLMRGDLPAGWMEFEWRWKTVPGQELRRAKHFLEPKWLGEQAIAGKRLLIHCERGLGDTLQFCRYVLMLLRLQATPILQVQAPLMALLRRLSPEIQIVGEAEPLPRFDLQCPLLSLPLIFKTALNTIPAARRYLSADAGRVARLRAKLAPRATPRATPCTRPRVGLVWRGDADNPDDRNRSIALTDLLAFLPPELDYFSLQKDLTAEERASIQAQPRVDVVNEDLNFEETAALCECLDLVLSIDSSVAHLAAALGRETWILLPFNPDCRWLLEREDSPWYPSVKLYRQTRAGDWHAPLARVRAELERLPLVTG